MTRLMVLLHVTPFHEHGDGFEMFHWTVLPRTAELNLMSAVLSASMSEKETSD